MMILNKIFRILGGVVKDSPGKAKYDVWNMAFQRLQEEKKSRGYSKEYWRIWYDEVCPAYIDMTMEHRKIGVGYDSLTRQVLSGISRQNVK